ncbi:MAG: transporter substrate-binding domain-containing protein, partial [Alphaproteobacteria bacterium]|nr:transporter substrate-binding domain-containing protein [Alphaproteobacteria bacterium]
KNFTIVPTHTFTDALHEVHGDRADLALVPIIYLIRYMANETGQDLETVGNVVTGGGLNSDVGIALPRDREALRDRLNQALRAILADGRYDAITSRFLPFSFY